MNEPEYTPELWAEIIAFFKAERGDYIHGCIFSDCLHTIAAKFLGTYRSDHQYDHDPDNGCSGCYMAHFR